MPQAKRRFVKADFSTIELRIMARLSGDKAMEDAFRDGVDLHRLTASKIGGGPPEDVTDSQRQAAKIMNFLLIYGGSAKSLQWRILSDYGVFISSDEAEEAKERFFQTYEGVREWQKQQLSMMSCTVQHHFHNCVQGFFELPLTCTKTILGGGGSGRGLGQGSLHRSFRCTILPVRGLAQI
jgi:DNA polymerase-1